MEAVQGIESKQSTRSTLIGLLSGFIAGLLNAVIARLLMRVIALLVSGEGSFSFAGTAMIFIFGALIGPLFGWIYRSTFYRLHTSEVVKGLLFGLAALFALQLPVLYIFPEFQAELMAAGSLGFPIFLLMNLSFMLTLAGLAAWLEKVWPRRAVPSMRERFTNVVLGLLALAGLLLLLFEIVARPLGLMS